MEIMGRIKLTKGLMRFLNNLYIKANNGRGPQCKSISLFYPHREIDI